MKRGKERVSMGTSLSSVGLGDLLGAMTLSDDALLKNSFISALFKARSQSLKSVPHGEAQP